MLQKQKLEYTDFSAGISENTVPGKPNAYARADNLLITRDKHLISRGGSSALSDTLYVLPALYQRVGALYNFYNDTGLLAQSGSGLFYTSGSPLSWSEVLGPTGGHAFQQNTAYSRVASGAFLQQLYLCSDSGDFPQVFSYSNAGAAQLFTAGLPRPAYGPTYVGTTFLDAACALAINLGSQMVSHMLEAYVGDYAHITADSTDAAAIAALTAPGNLVQLIPYVQGLVTAYNAHVADAQRMSGQVYHIGVQQAANPATGFLGALSVLNLSASTQLASPTDLTTTVAVLNDLRNRYNLHTYSTLTHQNAITSLATGGTYPTYRDGFGKWSCTLPTLEQNSTALDTLTYYNPVVSGGLSVLFAYVNQCVAEFNAHLGNAQYHNNADTDNIITVPAATDMFSAYVCLAHLEYFYWWHYQDASQTQASVGQTIVGVNVQGSDASNSLTTNGVNGTSYEGYTLMNLVLIGGLLIQFPTLGWLQGNMATTQAVTVTGGSTNAITLSANIHAAQSTAATYVASGSVMGIRLTTMKYHYDVATQNDGSLTNPVSYTTRLGAFDWTFQDAGSLVDALTAWFALFATHETSQWTLSNPAGSSPVYFNNNSQTINLFCIHCAPPLATMGWPLSGPAPAAQGGALWPQSTIPNPQGGNYNQTQAAQYFQPAPGAVGGQVNGVVGSAVVGAVLYTVVQRYDFTSGGLSFEYDSTPAIYSSVPWVQMPSGPGPTNASTFTATLTGLPVLTNLPGSNFDTAHAVLDIYRTITDGETFFLAGTVANGTTTFNDTVTDAQLLTNEPLYTTGGVLANDQAPASKFITVMNNTAYYAGVNDITSGQYIPNRVLQSIQDAPYSVPATNFDDLDDSITGLSNFNNYVIAFCTRKIYRMEGAYDELGNGVFTHQMVSPTIGGISHASIVQTEYGIFFCGTNGIYWTDGFTLQRTTGELEATYNALIQSPTQRARITGCYDKSTRRVYWTFCSQPFLQECDVAYVLDLNWGISDKMSFTTMSGGASFSPSALTLFNNHLIRGESYGFLFQHGLQFTSDPIPLLNQASTPSVQWAPQPIIYDFQSCNTNFGSSQVRKWVTRVTYQGQVQGNLYLQINRRNTDTGPWLPMVPVRAINTLVWGDPTVIWGDPTCSWGATGVVDAFRRMPAGSLRADWMAIQFTNAASIICGSDKYGEAATSARSAPGGHFTLTLPTATPQFSWPIWSTLYKVAFDQDGYVAQYAITARPTAQTLTIQDPNNTAPVSNANVAWQISGIAYGQRFYLTAYNLTWAPLADEQTAFQGPSSPGGGANLS